MTGENIGLIGPGRMGLAMVRHLIKAGYSVTATDVSAEQLAKAVEAGATPATNAAEVGASCDFAILGVGYDAETRAVTTGEGGLLETMKPGSVIGVSSTVAPDTVREIAEEAANTGVEIYDAPTCRGRWAADEGTLLALVGGADEVVARAAPNYSTICSDIAHLGDVGAGQICKAMNNFLMWVSGVAMIEAGRLGEELGMDLVKLRDALLISSARSAVMEDWDRMTFTWALKDMQVVSGLADQTGVSMPMAGAIREMVKESRRIKATNPPDWTGEGGIAKKP